MPYLEENTNQQSLTSRLGWRARPATSRDDGTGFFTLVGGYEVLVYELSSNRPVSGALIIAADWKELQRKIERCLETFEPLWAAQTSSEREANMVISERTARQYGWKDEAGSP